MKYYPEIPCRMILIPRDGASKLKFFDTEPCHIYHHGIEVKCSYNSKVNAWEEGDKIHFTSICLDKNFNMEWEQHIGLSNTSTSPGFVFNYTIDLANNT